MNLLEVNQRKLEAYETALVKSREELMSAAQFNRIVLEAAAVGGVVADLPTDLGDLKPWQVADWSVKVLEHVEAAKQPPSTGES
ncbi:MAG: hypothetical protein GY832_03885 [Chloroflexi bacterium]|nr:hypothetical protein [Chloroflexota bacterium]